MSPASEPGLIEPQQPKNSSRAEVLWLGDHRRSEFRLALQALSQQTDLSLAASIDEALAIVARSPGIELAVLAQAFPGQFSGAQVDALRRANPLMSMVALLGSWCEGEARSGTPWPGVPRRYWHQFVPWLQGELARRAAARPPHWTQPPTASDEERFLLASEATLAAGSGSIVIHSEHFDFSQFLADACRRQGFRPIELAGPALPRAMRGLRAALWDGDPCDGKIDRLAALVKAVRPAPVVALLSFPRMDQTERCLAAGAAAVVSKPLDMAELFRLL